jgi:hypothetical protein
VKNFLDMLTQQMAGPSAFDGDAGFINGIGIGIFYVGIAQVQTGSL